MNERELEAVQEIERTGAHIGTGLSPADYFMLYGTGEKARRDHEREVWNAQVDARKRAKRLTDSTGGV